jgi:hypothetical protein
MFHTKKLYNLLFEKEDKDTDSPEKPVHLKSGDLKARKSLYSVDSQIDALILRYESSSIREEDMQLDEYSILKKSLKYLIEQEDPLGALVGDEDEDEDEEGAPAEASEDEEPNEPEGNEKINKGEITKEEIPNLDVDAFTNRTVRLITNYRNLLRMEEAIVNRVKNFLDEHYGDEFVVRYLDTLRNEYGIEISEFDEAAIDDDIFAPGANPAATGGGG